MWAFAVAYHRLCKEKFQYTGRLDEYSNEPVWRLQPSMLKAEFTLEFDPANRPVAMDGETHLPSEEFLDSAAGTQSLPPKHVFISENFWPLDPRNVRAERISGLIVGAVFLTAATIAVMVVWFNLGFGWIWYSVAAGASLLITATLIGSFYWPSIEHRHASWRLDEEGLEIRRGVFWRHQITIPLGRVQHADVSQGPLQRPLGLGTLTIHTAGTQNASVELKGLSHDTAIELRDLIVRQRKDQNVV